MPDHRRPRLLEACKLARENNVRLALSAPTFEIWLLLHFRNIDVNWTTPEHTEAALTAQLRADGQPRAEANYEKGKFDCYPLLPKSYLARQRAMERRQDCQTLDTGYWGEHLTAWLADGRSAADLGAAMPCTDVDILLNVLNWKATPQMRLYAAN